MEKNTNKDAIMADKVLNFLERIRGLHALPPEELQNLLFERRFELLGSLNSSDPSMPEGVVANDKDKLPEYSTIPTQHELHEAILGGLIPQGYQCVAHVLYPESIPWPVRESPAATAEVPTTVAGAKSAIAVESSASAERSASSASVRSGPKRVVMTSRAASSSRLSVSASDGEADADGIARQESSAADSSRVAPSAEATVSSRGRRGAMNNRPSSATTVVHFTLCGQKTATTVRGKPVMEANEDVLALYGKHADDERYNAARAERVRLERAVKLEHYQENKLLEKIQNLELLRNAEIQHQEQIRKRESDRRARKDELKKDLEAAWVVKLQREKEQKELEKKRHEEEIAEKKKWKLYHEKQKEGITLWYQHKSYEWTQNGISSTSHFSEDLGNPKIGELVTAKAMERMKAEGLWDTAFAHGLIAIRTREVQEARQRAQEKEQEKEIAKRLKPKTVKAQLAVEKQQRAEEALERRPPLPPRPHDLGHPGADLLEDFSGSASARGATSSQPARRTPVSWTKEAQRISGNYGLTPRDVTAIEERLKTSTKGPGRMAKYSDK